MFFLFVLKDEKCSESTVINKFIKFSHKHLHEDLSAIVSHFLFFAKYMYNIYMYNGVLKSCPCKVFKILWFVMSFYLENIFCKLTIPTHGNILSTSYLQKIVFINLKIVFSKIKSKRMFLFPLFVCAIVKVY